MLQFRVEGIMFPRLKNRIRIERTAGVSSTHRPGYHVKGGRVTMNVHSILQVDSTQQTEAEPIGLQPHEFIKLLFGQIPNGFLEITYLAPEGAKLYPHTVVNWAALPLGDIDPELPNVMTMNAKGYSCYFGCTVKARKHEPETRISEKTGKEYTFYPRAKATDALYLTALWVDIDEPGQSGYQRAVKIQPPASVIVRSGGGYHAYWLLSKPITIDDSNRATIKQTLKGMAIACGSDTKVADLARIMRLPGTINTKPGRGTMCEAFDHLPCYYDYNELEFRYAPLAAPKIPPVQRSIPMTASKGMARWVEEYLNAGARQGDRNNRAFAAMRWLLDNGYSTTQAESMITQRAAADGLSDDEIRSLLNSAQHAERGGAELPRHMAIRMGVADKRIGGNKS